MGSWEVNKYQDNVATRVRRCVSSNTPLTLDSVSRKSCGKEQIIQRYKTLKRLLGAGLISLVLSAIGQQAIAQNEIVVPPSESDIVGTYRFSFEEDGEYLIFDEFVEQAQGVNYINYTDANHRLAGLTGSRSSATNIGVLEETAAVTELVPTGSGEWSLPWEGRLALAQGQSTTFSLVWDTGTRRTEKTFDVFLDTIAPTASAQQPQPLTILNENFSTLTYILDDAGSGLDPDSIQVYWDNFSSSCSLSFAGGCSLSFDASTGELEITLPATTVSNRNYDLVLSFSDRAGNRYDGGLYNRDWFYIDENYDPNTAANTVNGLQPLPEVNYTRNSNLSLSGSRKAFSEVYLDNLSTAPIAGIAAGDWTASQTVSLQEGDNTLDLIWAIHKVLGPGESTTETDEQSYRVVLDTTAPEVNLISPAADTVSSTSLSQVVYEFLDANGADLSLSRATILDADGNNLFSCVGTDNTQACWFEINESEISLRFNAAFANGIYQVNTRLYDVAGNWTNQNHNLYISDDSVPQGSLRFSSNALQPAPTENVIFSIFDLPGTISGIRYPNTSVQLNGEEIAPIGSGDWSFNFRQAVEQGQFLEEGLNTLSFSWVNDQGVASQTREYVVRYDVLGPEFQGVEPDAGSIVRENIDQLAILFDHRGSGLTTVSNSFRTFVELYHRERDWFVNCYAGNTGCDLTYDESQPGRLIVNFSEPLFDGIWEVQGELVDNSQSFGRSSNRREYFQFDYVIDTSSTEVPVGGIDFISVLPEINYITDSGYVLSGTRAPSTAVLINDVERIALGNGQWSLPLTDIMPEGDETLSIRWVNNSGTSSDTLQYRIVFDTVAPQVSGLPETLPTNTDQILFSILESGSGLSRDETVFRLYNEQSNPNYFCRFSSNGCSLSYDETTGDLVLTAPVPLEEGIWNLSIRTNDEAGNETFIPTHQFIVTDDPGGVPTSVVYNLDPLPSTNTVGQNVYNGSFFSGKRSENTAVHINGEERVPLGSGDWQIQYTDVLQRGTNNLDVTWVNSAGVSSDVVSFVIYVDFSAPRLTQTVPADGGEYSEISEFTLTVIEEDTQLETSDVRVDIYQDGTPLYVCNTSNSATNCQLTINGDLVTVAPPESLTVSGRYDLAVYFPDIAGRVLDDDNISDSSLRYIVSGAGETVPKPVLDTYDSEVTQARVVLSGSKGANTYIVINGNQLNGFFSETTWQAEVNLQLGLNQIEIFARSLSGAQESDPVIAEVTYNDLAPGEVPFSLQQSADGTEVTVSWASYNETDNGADIAEYQVYRSLSPITELNAAALATTVPAGTFTTTLSGIVLGETNYITVVAQDQAGQQSDGFNVQTITTTDQLQPGNVGDLAVELLSNAEARIFWTAPTVNAGDLSIYRVFIDDTAVADIPVDTLEYTVSNLTAATAYTVRVVAIDSVGNESSGVTQSFATLFANPVNVVADPASNSATVSWDALPSLVGVERFNLYVSDTDFTDVSAMTAVVSASANATSASIGGLTNGQTYYIAVTTENISGLQENNVQTVAVTPQADVTPPVIDEITFNGNPFTDGQTLSDNGEICVLLSDDSAISRVEFYLDSQLVFTSSSNTAGYCYTLLIEPLADGAHALEIRAFDSYDNQATQSLSFVTQLASPEAPVISEPEAGVVTNQTLITVRGTAEPNTEVQITVEDQTTDWFPVNASGQFVIDTSLVVDGDNTLSGKARNRAGESVASVAVVVELDRSLPSRPLGLVATTLDSGEVRLEWAVNSSTGVAGFDLYRSTQSFDLIAQAEKINNTLITGASFNDVLVDDGTYYYRVVSVNELGTVSEPSALAQIDADSTAPVAQVIRYTTDGVYDAASETYGVGTLAIELTVSEPLLTVPFLSISPDGGAPINVLLTPVSGSELDYTGELTLDAGVGSGVAFAVFSARDKAGNRGTEVLEGAQINIDTQGPQVINLTTAPETPIKNDSANPVAITVVFDLDETIANNSTFDVSYQLSGDNRQPTPINDVVKLADRQWQATVQLPANAGQGEPELISFSFSAEDALGNTGTQLNREYVTQIYQGDLPPLATPFNFRGNAIAGGKVQLEWVVVPDAVAYQLYRKAPGEADFTEYLRLEADGYHEDQTAVDGLYEYQIASIRSANSMESQSALSDIVSVTTDSVAPDAPTNLTLELTPIGIQSRWNPISEPNIRYRLYRDATGPIVTTDGLTATFSDLVEPQVVDTNATQQQPAYTVVAVDEVGNESAPADTAYLNVDLLPVASLSVRLEQGSKPTIGWTHSSDSISNYDIYLGTDNTGVQLNSAVLSQTEFVDNGYANNQRQYAVVALDSNGQQSLARSIVLPKTTMSLQANQSIKRNLINTVSVTVQNTGTAAVQNARVKLVTATDTYQSLRFDLPAGANQSISVVVPGLEDLPDQWDLSLELHSQPNPGESIQIAQPASLAVQDGTMGLRFETDEFIRGGDGSFNVSLTNTGDETIQLITARNFGNQDSPDVMFTLVDGEDNVLALQPFRQALGEGVVNTANGGTVARIEAGEQWTSKQLAIVVPDNAPDEVYLLVQINNLYAGLGTAEEVRVKGPKLRQLIRLEQTPYTGSVDSIAPESSFGDQPVVITGKALERDTQAPLANTDLKIVIEVSGFEREFEVITDASGAYELSYQPQKGESGRYTVSALHPVLTSRPNDGEFVINRLEISPDRWDLNIPYLFDFDLDLRFTPGDGTELTNLRFEMRAEDQPSGEVPAGITLTYPQIAELNSQNTVRETIVVRAESEAEQTGQFIVAVFADQSPDTPIGLIDVIYQLSEAKPAIFHSPSVLELGTTLDGVASGSITIENRGLTELTDVNVALVTGDGFPAPDWLKLVTSDTLGSIDLEEKKTVDIQMLPNNAAPVGVEQLFLEITSSNAEPYYAPIFTAIAESGEGGALFKITDMYTGTLDGQGRLIQGLPGATIRLQNEAIPSIQFALVADELGEAIVEDIPAGRYSAWISSDNYQEEHVRLRIQPGLINSQQVFLDYNLIRLEWSVSEITIEDRYEIVLNATFETDVPAAVVMLEPTNIPLPEMEAGDVLYGELSLTNYGLIRAFDVQFTPQQSDEFYQFDYLTSVVPSSLEAKEVVIIPYKITALKSLEQQDGSGGNTCGAYGSCAQSQCLSRCPTGVSESNSASCATRSYGTCSSPPSRNSGSGGGGGGGGGGLGGGGAYPRGGGMPPCRGDGTCPEGR